MGLTNKEKHELNKQNWTWKRNLTRKEKEELGLSQVVRGVYICNTCGAERFIVNSNFNRRLTVCNNGCHGAGCDTNQVIVGLNDLATTHPQMVKYLADTEDAKRIKASSNHHIKVKCPRCGFQREMLPYNLIKREFFCPCCSDGVSAPERFMTNILHVLGVKFKKEYRLGDNRRYDFYIPSLNAIIETHGIQHYTGSFVHLSGKGLEHEQENDKQKREQALNSGVTHYIELDCRENSFDFLLSTVYNSPLNGLLELDKVDWEEVKERMATSLMVEVIDYFNSNNVSVIDLAKKFNIGSTSVARYLIKGTELGMCDYQRDGGAKARSDKNKMNKTVMVQNGMVARVEDGACVMSKVLGYTSNSRICELCKGEGMYGHFTNSPKLGGKVGFYYVESEDWGSVKDLYIDINGLLKQD